MAIIENTTDYAVGDQLTVASLNALTEAAKLVKSTGAVASTGNTTDETTLDVNSSGELIVKSLGVGTAQLAADAVTGDKIADNTLDSEHYAADSIDNEHLANNAVDSDELAAGSVDFAHFSNDVVSAATVHSDLGAGSIPEDADKVLTYDDSAGDHVSMTLAQLGRHAMFPKAYGTIDMDAGTKADDYNVSTIGGTATDRTVTLSVTMGASYVVTLSIKAASGAWTAASYQINSTTQFTISKSVQGGDPFVSFAVFGAQANL